MKKFGKLTGHRVNGNIISLEFENGTGRLEIITDRIINVFSSFESEAVSYTHLRAHET